MTKRAFATFVYGGYHKFLPFYTYCINATYPDVSIIIFYNGQLPLGVKKNLEENSSVVLYDNFKMDHEWLQQYNHRGAVKQSLRHLLPFSYFKDYDEVYLGDVDILILKEEIDLFEFHKKQAEKHELPFSNKVRILADGSISKRLTGLHYISPSAYYNKIQPVINEIANNPSFRDSIFSKSLRNEEVLYYINEEAFQFNPEALSKNERPWHGFHLGLVRGKDFLNENTVAENSSISLQEIKRQLTDLFSNDEFERMMLDFYCPELYYTLLFLGVDVSKRIQRQYQREARKQKVRSWVWKFRKKIRI